MIQRPLVAALFFLPALAVAAPIENGVDEARPMAVHIALSQTQLLMVKSATCTGELVGPDVVLTAAHCIAAVGGRPDSIEVTIGAVREPVARYATEPGYDVNRDVTPEDAPFDLALLQLRDSFDGFLPVEEYDAPKDVGGQPVELQGFAGSDALKGGTNRILAYTDGVLLFDGLEGDRIGQDGAAHADGTDVGFAHGDSGGPILAQDGGVLGVVSLMLPFKDLAALRQALTGGDDPADGAAIADDLQASASGPNPKQLYEAVSLSSPSSEKFFDEAAVSGYNVRIKKIAARRGAGAAAQAFAAKSQALDQLSRQAPQSQ